MKLHIDKHWTVFLVFAITMLLKELFFNWSILHHLQLFPQWSALDDYAIFWLGKLVAPLFLASFVFLSKRIWWTVCINCVIDLWCIANAVFYRSYSSLLTWDVIGQANNLQGFENSVWMYLQADILFYPLLTIFGGVALWWINKSISQQINKSTSRRVKESKSFRPSSLVFVIIASLFCSMTSKYLFSLQVMGGLDGTNMSEEKKREKAFTSYFPFGEAYHYAFKIQAYDETSFGRLYVSRQSIVSYIAAMPLYHYWVKGEEVSLTEEEERNFERLLVNRSTEQRVPSTSSGQAESKSLPNVIILLVESLESWPIDPVVGYEYMPNLSKLAKDENTMFCNRIVSETKHGNSGDGQMTVLTGLLPISSGAACCLYDQNVYPSFVHNYDNAIIVNPAPNAWHQDKMSVNYGFCKVVEPTPSENADDEWVLSKMAENVQHVDTPFVMLGITLTTHVPFEYGKKHKVHSPVGMPDVMNNYLNTLYYTDACIGKLIDALHETRLDENTVLVITGDHNIFRDANYSKEMDEYAAQNGIDFKNGHTYIPLIVYSKRFIKHNTLVEEEHYQMDIYPTIAQFAGTDLWRGVGIAIDDSTSQRVNESTSRTISEAKAYELSDKIIRSNYFKKYRDK